MISQQQAKQADALCTRALSIIEKIQRDFDEMQKAAAEFNKRMAERNAGHG